MESKLEAKWNGDFQGLGGGDNKKIMVKKCKVSIIQDNIRRSMVNTVPNKNQTALYTYKFLPTPHK